MRDRHCLGYIFVSPEVSAHRVVVRTEGQELIIPRDDRNVEIGHQSQFAIVYTCTLAAARLEQKCRNIARPDFKFWGYY